MATLRILALLTLAPFAAAQSKVWTVGGQSPHFTDLQAAVNAAADGDTVLVRSGTYGAFHLVGKGISITADLGAVMVQGQSEIEHVPMGSSVQLVRLQFRGNYGYQSTPSLIAHDCGGVLRFSACAFTGGSGLDSMFGSRGSEALRISRCDDAALLGCSALGGRGSSGHGGWWGGDGLFVRDSLIALYDSSFMGGAGGSDAFDDCGAGGRGGDGYESPDAVMYASGCIFQGGMGGNGGEEDGNWSDDCDCYAGAGGSGGHGVFLGSWPPGLSTPIAELQGCSAIAGAYGWWGLSYYCSPGLLYYPPGTPPYPGQPIYIANGIATPSSTPARKMTTPNPVREATSVALSFTGVNGDRVWLLQSLLPEHSTNTPFEGCLLVKSGFLTRGSMKGVIGASGQLAATLQLASLPLGVETSVLQLQMLVFDATGAGVLGSAVPLVILDSQF